MSFMTMQESLKEVKKEDIEAIAQRLIMADQVFLMGNGGSASTASHIANDLHAAGINATSLCDNIALLTAIANDKEYPQIFIDQLAVKMRPGDVVIAISGSGNSENVIRAVNFANGRDVFTIGLLGFGGGKLREMVKLGIILESHNYGLVESVHLLIGHLITDEVRNPKESQK